MRLLVHLPTYIRFLHNVPGNGRPIIIRHLSHSNIHLFSDLAVEIDSRSAQRESAATLHQLRQARAGRNDARRCDVRRRRRFTLATKKKEIEIERKKKVKRETMQQE